MKTSNSRNKTGRVILGILLLLAVLIASGFGYLKFFKPDVGPPPILKVTSTPRQIERGRYLANYVLACIDCHSTRNWNEFTGPMVAGTLGKGGDKFGPQQGFPGTFYAPNITSAALHNWTDGELFRAITTGVTQANEPIFPVMPYHYYGQADSSDIIAVIAYIRRLPAIANQVPASKPDFPVNLIMRTMPSKAHLHAMPDSADAVKYGAYLVSSAGCMDCHTQTDKGTPIKGLEFSGGREFGMPGGKLHSANITPDKQTGIGSWTPEMFINRFAQYRDEAAAHRKVTATEFNSIMPWTMYAHITDHDLRAMFAYLQTVKPLHNQIIKFVPGKQNNEL